MPKTIIITGADGGLGSAVTAQLLKNGHQLIASAVSQKSVDKLQSLFPEAFGSQLKAVIAYLSDESAIDNLFQQAENVNGLVHLAGGYTAGASIADYSLQDYQHLMNLNVLPTFLLLKKIVPILKANGGGAIVTVGAKPAIHQSAGNAVYAASKSAVITLTLSTAEEGRGFNIRANCIAPATLQTPNNLSWATPEQFKTFTPIADVAAVIAFLQSEEGVGINGMVIPMYNKLPA